MPLLKRMRAAEMGLALASRKGFLRSGRSVSDELAHSSDVATICRQHRGRSESGDGRGECERAHQTGRDEVAEELRASRHPGAEERGKDLEQVDLGVAVGLDQPDEPWAGAEEVVEHGLLRRDVAGPAPPSRRPDRVTAPPSHGASGHGGVVCGERVEREELGREGFTS